MFGHLLVDSVQVKLATFELLGTADECASNCVLGGHVLGYINCHHRVIGSLLLGGDRNSQKFVALVPSRRYWVRIEIT